MEQKVGFSYTTDLEPESLGETLSRSVELAREATPDEYAGLPEPSEVDQSDLEIFDEAVLSLSVAEMIEKARTLERIALDRDRRLRNSEGAACFKNVHEVVLVNTRGVKQSYRETICGLMCAPVAEDRGEKQVNYWFSNRRHLQDLEDIESIAQKAADRTLRMLGSRKVQTGRMPVVFDPLTGSTLLSSLVSALDGDRVYKKASFLADKRGERIGSEWVCIVDDGRLPRGLGSRPFDGEGVATGQRIVFDRGVLREFFYDTHTARKVGTKPTGNAYRSYRRLPQVGPSNFYLKPGSESPEEILRGVKKGLYVTGLMGWGVNTVTGDFSIGAEGMWIQGGELTHPVQGVTLAGNLVDLLANIEAVANDLIFHRKVAAPTFRVAELTIGGK